MSFPNVFSFSVPKRLKKVMVMFNWIAAVLLRFSPFGLTGPSHPTRVDGSDVATIKALIVPLVSTEAAGSRTHEIIQNF